MTGITKQRDRELEALVQLRDEDIDTSDIAEVTDWGKAVIGRFYRPIKEAVTVRLDADVVAWLKSAGPGYQTRMNALLRAAMARDTARVSAHEARKTECGSPAGGRAKRRTL